MTNPNLTDMTEEDAADLQFPKGMFIFFLLPSKKRRQYCLFLTYNHMTFVNVFSDNN